LTIAVCQSATVQLQYQTPRAAYVHVPFCSHRCGYCNFTLVAGRNDLVEPYLQAIERELESVGQPNEVDTLFFGGGTPTHLPAPQLQRLIRTVKRRFPPASRCEISIEANPADVCDELSGMLADEGVTRISLGGQSLRAEKLQTLERDHSPEELIRAVETTRKQFASVSLDLIFAAPGETFDQWRADLQGALALPIDHLSTYGLTFERGTTFWSRLQRNALRSADEELERAMYAEAIERLTSAGFEHYEISNFARPGHRCRHNETYWSGDAYFAVGPGAARYVNGRREINHRSTTTYIKRVLSGQSPVFEVEELAADDRARELLVFGLRRRQGVAREEFERRTGVNWESLLGVELQKMIDLGLLEEADGRLRLTHEGLFVSDAIWPRFLRA
jgi:oxygen-independent coproporphyrinogen III oxidase